MITISTNTDRALWNHYVAEHDAAKFSLLYDWSACLAATYGLSLFRLAAIKPEAGRISGILPLLLFDPPGSETRLISLPYTDSAGILADDWESGRQLLCAALQLADELGANHLELRQDGALHAFFEQQAIVDDNWNHVAHTFKTGLLRALPASADELWREISAKIRNQVRKARRCGCVAVAGGRDLLPDFYAVFSENMRDLGSPVHSKDLFRNILESEPAGTSIIVVYLDGKPAAAGFVLRHNQTACNPWSSSLRSYRPSCPNMLLYWSMLEYAVNHRCRWFDFGRSTPGAPTCRFKMQWGAELDVLCWHVFSSRHHKWNPGWESLEYDDWKRKDLMHARRDGPAIRRWISL